MGKFCPARWCQSPESMDARSTSGAGPSRGQHPMQRHPPGRAVPSLGTLGTDLLSGVVVGGIPQCVMTTAPRRRPGGAKGKGQVRPHAEATKRKIPPLLGADAEQRLFLQNPLID